MFVFPSRTDTFGVVQLEALACGVPVAAYPVTGPQDVIGDHPVGVLDDDLRAACLGALQHFARRPAATFALTRSWETSARQFIGHMQIRSCIGSHRDAATPHWPSTAAGAWLTSAADSDNARRGRAT